MKNKIFLILLILSIITKAQNFTLSLKSGYAFAANKYNSSTDIPFIALTNQEYINDKLQSEYIEYSFGKGIPLYLAVGFQTNKNIAFNIGFYYNIGNSYSAEFKSDKEYSDYSNQKYSGKIKGLVPSIKFIAPLNEKLYLYAETGLMIAMPEITAKIYSDEGEYDPTIRHIYEEEYRIYGGISYGFSSNVGIAYKINKIIALSFDVSYLGLTFKPTNAEKTKYTIDGEDVLDKVSIESKEYIFVDEYSDYEAKKSTEIIKTNYPFSNIVLNLGVVFLF